MSFGEGLFFLGALTAHPVDVHDEVELFFLAAGPAVGGREEVVDLLHDEYGWSDSVSNLSGKLQRESLRYREAVELADVLGYELVWQKRRD